MEAEGEDVIGWENLSLLVGGLSSTNELMHDETSCGDEYSMMNASRRN